MQTATAASESKTAHLTSMDNVRCYEFDGFGHMSKTCPRLSNGKKMCFVCKQFTSHIAANCPQRLQRQRGETLRYNSTPYKSGNRGDRVGRGRYGGNKRKGDNVDSHCDSKRPRSDKNNARGNKRNWRGPRRGGEKSDTTDPREKTNARGSENNNVDTSKCPKSTNTCTEY